MNDIHATVQAVILSIAREKSPDLHVVSDAQGLVEELGLKSLDLARLIAILDLQLNVEPFAERVAITSIRTVGDLYRAYALCLGVPVEMPATASLLESAKQRGIQRRERAISPEARRKAGRGRLS